MPLNSYLQLGRSGLKVSPFTLGAMTFGNDHGWGASVAESEAILSAYIAAGGNVIDTADGYTKGHSEKIIGDYLRARPGQRDRLVLSTKGGMTMFGGDPNGGGANLKTIISACEQSLRRLQTDYIDIYWMHQPDPWCPLEETMRALDRLVDAGKVRYVGFSDMPAWKVARAHTLAELRGWTPLSCLQFEYSLLERTVEHELIPAAQELGLGVLPWGPLKGGILTGKYNDPAATGRAKQWGVPISSQQQAVIDALREIADELGSTAAAVALHWLHKRPGVSSVLLGARTVGHLEANLGALDLAVPADQLTRLDALSAPEDTFATRFQHLATTVIYDGLTINGVAVPRSFVAPGPDDPTY